jgi:cation diffusion facilitator family transporter
MTEGHGTGPGGGPLPYALAAIAVGVVVLGLKLGAWALTGSVALLSDALESIVNVAAAVAAAFAIRLAGKPPDDRHPYGHGKAEYVSAVVEGALILVAAVAIIVQAAPRLMEPVRATQLDLGLLVATVASALNGVMAVVLVRAGRRHRSPALVADGQHIGTDVVTSVGVLLGVGLAELTGFWILDPLLAVVVGLNIVRIGWRTVASSVGGLMDESLPDDERAALRRLIEAHLDGALEAHALRSRRSGRYTFVMFHLVVPGEMTVTEAHALCDRLEAAIVAERAETFVTIHLEPESKAKCREGGRGRVFDLAGPHGPPTSGQK